MASCKYIPTTSPVSQRGYVERDGWNGEKVRAKFTVLESKPNTVKVQFDTGQIKVLKRWQVRFGQGNS